LDLTPWPPFRYGVGERKPGGLAGLVTVLRKATTAPSRLADGRCSPSRRGKGLGIRSLLAATQYVSALAMGPSYLGRGFGALIGTPIGAAAHLGALALALAILVVHFLRRSSIRPSHLALGRRPLERSKIETPTPTLRRET
ncbi:MAG: hypothetical protein ACRDI2_01435, partial [Chloroflexota bacterium]